LGEPSVHPSEGRCFAHGGDAIEHVCIVICEEEIGRFSIEAQEFLVPSHVLGSLNDKTEVKRNALTWNGGIIPRVTCTSCGLAYLAGPAGVTSLDIGREFDRRDAVDMLVKSRQSPNMNMPQPLMPQDACSLLREVAYLRDRRVIRAQCGVWHQGFCEKRSPNESTRDQDIRCQDDGMQSSMTVPKREILVGSTADEALAMASDSSTRREHSVAQSWCVTTMHQRESVEVAIVIV
jgi:hypothetical protein